MRRSGFLFEPAIAWGNLMLATKKAARGKRSRPEVARFLFDLEPGLIALQGELLDGSWRPGEFRTFQIRDPKPRTISAAPFRDRVVHHALMNVLDPIFDRSLIGHTYACRRGKGTHRALAHARLLARRNGYFLKGDIEACFESIDHTVMKAQLRRILKDHRLLEVLDRIIDAGGARSQPGVGLPIGNLTSQYFANHYLGRFDRFVTQQLGVRGYLRYMDDFLLFAADKSDLHRWRAEIRAFLAECLHLRLKESVSFVAPARRGIPFLGFAVFPGAVRLQGTRKRRTLARIRLVERRRREGLTSEEDMARCVTASLAHVQHADTLGLRRGWWNQP